jgi:putative membrane protein
MPVPAPTRGDALTGLDTDWRRLDPRMLLVHPVQELVRFLPALLVVFVTGRTQERSPWWDLGALGIVVGLGMSRWFTTRYRIHNAQIQLRAGLLRRRVLATPAERVRTVDVTASIWHRLLGLAKVEIGTASGGNHERIILDALTAQEAARLRGELLHRRVAPVDATVPQGDPNADAGRRHTESTPEVELLRLDPAWVRYAPLTTSGLVSALAVWGFAWQLLGDTLQSHEEQVQHAIDAISKVSIWVGVLVAAVLAIVGVSALAVTAYVLSDWGFRLTRHAGGTLHVARGLLTTRRTSIEEARLRGVEIGEPLGLRLVGAARLRAITTGLHRRDDRAGSAALAPPAPRSVVVRVADAVVGDNQALLGPLVQHGPVARRRRYVRAVVPALALCGSVGVIGLRSGAAWTVGVPCLVVVLASPLLARDRYAALGHLLTPAHLVARAGTFSRRRDVLAREGVIGVVVRESFFQRRSGLATLTATTAAGKQGYHVLDLSRHAALELSQALLPQAVGQFCEPVASPQRRPQRRPWRRP